MTSSAMLKQSRRTKTRKPRGLGYERRGEILEAAKAIFIAEGYQTVTTRKLAERVGLSQTGLYLYFKNKEEILDAICSATFANLLQRLMAVEAEMGITPDSAKRLLETYIEFALAHPDEYQLSFMISHAHKEAADLSLPFEEQPVPMQAFLAFQRMIAKLQAAGLVKVDDATVGAEVFWAAAHGLVSLQIAHPKFPWADRQAIVDTMTDLLLSRR